MAPVVAKLPRVGALLGDVGTTNLSDGETLLGSVGNGGAKALRMRETLQTLTGASGPPMTVAAAAALNGAAMENGGATQASYFRTLTGQSSNFSGKHGDPSGERALHLALEEAAVVKQHLRRSASAASSGFTKMTPPSWVRPILRRSASAGSTHSSLWTAESVPEGLTLDDLREANAVRVTWERPAHDVYNFVEKFGEGGFGQVWKCIKKDTQEAVAIKRIKAKEKADVDRLLRELKAFERFNHPHIVKLHEVFVDREFLFMVMDLCTGGDLLKYMEAYRESPWRAQRKYEFPEHVLGLPAAMVGFLMWQMLAGIAYMHHHRFVHRDIKLQNYVIKEPSPTPVLQLVDFGMAARFSRNRPITGIMGTVKYMAPEVLRGLYNEKCDIWSIGVVCYMLCTQHSPWGPGKTSQQLSRCILENAREPWPSCDKPKALRLLIDLMLTRKIEDRPSALALMKTNAWLRAHSVLQPAASGAGDVPCCAVS